MAVLDSTVLIKSRIKSERHTYFEAILLDVEWTVRKAAERAKQYGRRQAQNIQKARNKYRNFSEGKEIISW